MRYRTFRNSLVTVAVCVGVLGGYALCRGKAPSPGAPAEVKAATPGPVAPSPVAASSPAPVSAAPAAPAPAAAEADAEALRPMDREILERVAKNIPGDKVKDAVPGRPWKVNLYRDAGQSGVNRLKVDLNRNEKWEEKWTFSTEGGKQVVKRQVAPADDERYTVEYRLEGDRWRRK